MISEIEEGKAYYGELDDRIKFITYIREKTPIKTVHATYYNNGRYEVYNSWNTLHDNYYKNYTEAPMHEWMLVVMKGRYDGSR